MRYHLVSFGTLVVVYAEICVNFLSNHEIHAHAIIRGIKIKIWKSKAARVILPQTN